MSYPASLRTDEHTSVTYHKRTSAQMATEFLRPLFLQQPALRKALVRAVPKTRAVNRRYKNHNECNLSPETCRQSKHRYLPLMSGVSRSKPGDAFGRRSRRKCGAYLRHYKGVAFGLVRGPRRVRGLLEVLPELGASADGLWFPGHAFPSQRT